MKYSIEIGKIVEGAFKRDITKVFNYTKQLVTKLEEDKETIAAKKFSRILAGVQDRTLLPMDMAGKTNLGIPVDNESRSILADVLFPNENHVDVILSQNNAKRIESFLLSYQSADLLNTFGLEVPHALLLYGPPGCGKTKCAQLIAKKLKLPLVIARLDSIISSYLGTTAKNIRMLFEFIQKMPCVLFLDEFDAIAKARDDRNELGELKRVVNSLLQNIDSMNPESLLIAATNHDQLLDSAVWRRFDYKLEIELPDLHAILKLIDLFTCNAEIFSEKEKKEFAAIFDGLSGASIEEIIKNARRNAIIHGYELSKAHIYEEFFQFKNILPQGEMDSKSLLKIKAKYLRECNEKIFSLQVIADLFQCSKSKIVNVLKQGEIS